MPEIYGLEYLVSHLNELNWCNSNGMGIVAISWSEIQAYNECMGYPLNSEECKIIKKMSNSYVRELQDKNPVKKPPFNAPKI